MKRSSSRRWGAGLAAAVALMTSVAIAAPAQAATSSTKCSNTVTVVGESTTTFAHTYQSTSLGCGQVRVKVGYYGPGGTSLFSAYRYNNSSAYISSSEYGSIFRGYHGVTEPDVGYSYASVFTT